MQCLHFSLLVNETVNENSGESAIKDREATILKLGEIYSKEKNVSGIYIFHLFLIYLRIT